MFRGSCPVGFYEFQSRCYFFELSSKKTYASARSACKARHGAGLLVANNDQVLDFVLHYMYQVNLCDMYFSDRFVCTCPTFTFVE